MFALRRSLTALLTFVCLATPLFAGFQSTETYLVAVGRAPGQFGAQIYSTVWATNLSGAPNQFTVYFLKQGQANNSPASFSDTLAPGETKIYENIVESKFHLTSVIGAARIVSSGEILVSERIYNQPSGADLGSTEGFFFAGVPKTFSISSGQSASIQGVNQGGSENFRSNFILVETGGASTTVNVQVFDNSGTQLGQKAYPLQAYEQFQGNVTDIVPSIATTNGRITATVTGGTGSALLAGAQVANESQDASGFEMSFRDDLLGGTSSGGGLTAVIHDSTLTGSGTNALPLGVNPGAVVTSLNGFRGAVTLSPGSNVTITPSGSTLTIASTGGGGGGGLTLPFSGSYPGGSAAFVVTDTGTGGDAIQGFDSDSLHSAVAGFHSAGGTGVYASSNSGYGVKGISSSGTGVFGVTSATTGQTPGVLGRVGNGSGQGMASGTGVWGDTSGPGAGVEGTSAAGSGVLGVSPSGNGVTGLTTTGFAVFGHATADTNNAGVFNGGITVTNGSKSFVEPHPSDPTREIRYVCLEGRESGTYFRGTARIVNGFATIDVPEDFRMVSRPDGLTVQLTPVGEMAALAAVSRSLDKIVVQGSKDVAFDYMVNGVRATVPVLEPIEENRFFVPRTPTDRELTRPLDPEVRARLVRSGILNQDGSINLETAHRLAWDQQESWKRAEAAKQ